MRLKSKAAETIPADRTTWCAGVVSVFGLDSGDTPRGPSGRLSVALEEACHGSNASVEVLEPEFFVRGV